MEETLFLPTIFTCSFKAISLSFIEIFPSLYNSLIINSFLFVLFSELLIGEYKLGPFGTAAITQASAKVILLASLSKKNLQASWIPYTPCPKYIVFK